MHTLLVCIAKSRLKWPPWDCLPDCENPLFGHPALPGVRAAKTFFPLGGLRPSLNSGCWNLRALTPAAHRAAHQGLRATERWAAYAVNPLTPYLRFENQF